MSTKNLCWRPELTRGVIALSLFFMAWTAADANTISIDLGPSPNVTNYVATNFSNLNGTSLQGQTLSLDFLFANGKFARLFSATNPGFEIAITLNTSGSGLVGFLDGSAYLLDQSGNALGTPQGLGSASGDGTLGAGLLPLASGQYSTPLDFFGVHAQLILPTNASISVTGGEFALISAGANHRDVFGIGPGVPTDILPQVVDSGSTLSLFSLMLFALPMVRRRISPSPPALT